MRATEFIIEAPLKDYVPLGDFDKPGPFRGADKKLVPHPTNQLKAVNFFKNTPYDFRLFFSNIPGTSKWSATGEMTPVRLRDTFGEKVANQLIDGSENSITGLFIGNMGDEKVPLTPWMMAHRIGHAIAIAALNEGGNNAWAQLEKHFFKGIHKLLKDFYGIKKDNRSLGPFNRALRQEYSALFNAIGTQHSSRTGQIKRPYEFVFEMFAQYIGTGKITLNPLPKRKEYGRKAWGRSTQSLNMRPKKQEESVYTTEVLAKDMEIMFDDVLSNSVGKILVI
ncbi:MAG: hypothetical protein ACO3E1_12100 [Flavobacteriales bacterium]